MSSNQTMHPSPQWMAAMAARGYPSVGQKANRLTISGIALFIVGASIVLSGFRFSRLPVFNLKIQPYLIPVAAALPFVLPRLPKFPVKVLAGLLIFWTLYAFSLIGTSVQRISPMEDAVKLGLSIAVIVTVALLVNSRADFVAGSLGLCLAIGVLAGRGLEEEQENIIEVANKNSYSLYALPAVLLAIYISLRVDWKKVSFRKLGMWVMLACSLVSAVAIFVGGNRSGYLGMVLIVLMTGFYTVFSPRFTLVKRSARAVRLAILIASVVVGVAWKGTEVLERRLDQTVQGTDSDTLRKDLFFAAVVIGIEHPIRGVSPQVLPVLLVEKLFPGLNPGTGYETHNVFADIIGGCGLITTAVLMYTGLALFFWRPRTARWPEANADFYDARTFLRMMLILWAVRGMFSQEILYNPGFCMGLGLAIGLCMVELEQIRKSASAGYPPMGQMISPYAARS